MAVKTEIWVKAHLRTCFAAGLTGVVAKRGADEAGAVYIQVFTEPDRVVLRAPAPGPTYDEAGHRQWSYPLGETPVTAAEARAYLDRQATIDRDIWILDIDDPAGSGLL
jgi:hypothetical protein